MPAFIAKLSFLVGIALLLAAAGSLYLNISDEKQSELLGQFLNDTGETSKHAAKAVIGYDLATPSWQREWRGDPNTLTPILEDLPLPDSRDAFILVPYWFLAILVSKLLWRLNINVGWRLLAILFLFTAGTLIVWLLWKWFMYGLMIENTNALGIKEEVLTARAAITEGFSKALGWLAVFSLANFVILAWALWPGKGGK